MHNAGSKVKSQIKANAIMSAERSPNWKVGRKADKVNTKKPETKTVVVIIRADPVFMIVLRKASIVGNPLDNSFLYRSKNEVNHQRRYLMLQKMSWLWGHEWGY